MHTANNAPFGSFQQSMLSGGRGGGLRRALMVSVRIYHIIEEVRNGSAECYNFTMMSTISSETKLTTSFCQPSHHTKQHRSYVTNVFL